MGQSTSSCESVEKEESKQSTKSPFSELAPGPQIEGIQNEDSQKLILFDRLASAIVQFLPPSCTVSGSTRLPKWYLLFSSAIHGKSFQSLVQRITSKGPTLLVIQLKDSSRIIGAFCESDWLTVSEREKAARSVAAAAARAFREGQLQLQSSAPKNQNNLFFGNENCFLFRSDGKDDANTSFTVDVYKSQPSMNSNFMYLFDTHPLEEKIGIGMGGQPGYFGWFLDRWLESGMCYGTRCTTFLSPRLSSEEKWSIEVVEAYAVGPDFVEKLMSCTSNPCTVNKKSCVSDGNDATTTKALLELHGIHAFDRSERPEY